jgi:hypothetical protein
MIRQTRRMTPKRNSDSLGSSRRGDLVEFVLSDSQRLAETFFF